MDTNKIESNTLALSCQHTLNPTHIVTSNRYTLLCDDANDDATVIHSNTSTLHNNQQTPQPKKNAVTHKNYTTAQLKIAKNMAVADAGATGHFVLPGTTVTNIKVALHTLKINQPDGDCLTSTHTCTLDTPWLPNDAKEAHIVPGLEHASLISIIILCNAGCKVTYNDAECRVYYNKKVVWLGKREPQTGLWILPLTETTWQPQTTITDVDYNIISEKPHKRYAHNAYAMAYKSSRIQYLHQSAFSPPKATFLKSLHNNQFATWPGLTAKAVQKYLPESSPATDKGHMKRQKQGIFGTKDRIMTALKTIETARDMNQPMEK